ncbi:MAG: protein kinase, partial [Bryobacteraceae bacterium]|nr:protein kinase [Bryobacteraceae bacterium]
MTESQIGPYELVRELGSGGMGTVYLARRTGELTITAALKVLRPGLDSEFFLARFAQEGQILATLEHPNIARVIDGGRTADGRPYFALEYVEGVPLDAYAAKLGLEARLALFRQVCAAVHYAHQRLVIHRDLKPGNVLVTAEGVPKLLDFGIAKLLNEQPGALRTRGDLRLMTPEYASPEQVRGGVLTTASDVYALGVILYQLVTGKLPYEFREQSYTEYERVIGREAPRAPSSWGGKVAPDLEQIVLMALRKEPERRYASAEQLSEDVRRYLEGRPVKAQPDTFGYRTSKFVRRNAWGVAAGVALLLTLGAGIAATLWQARIAERRFNDVRKLATSFIFEFHDAIESLPGSTPARQLVVKRGLEYLDRLAAESSGDSQLQTDVADAYVRIGNVLGNPQSANLGDRAGAMRAYERAAAIFERVAKETNRPRAWTDLADAMEKRGDLLEAAGKSQEAVAVYRQGLAMAKAQSGSPDLTVQAAIARSYAKLGDAQVSMGQTKESLESYTQSLALYKVLAEKQPEDVRRQVAMVAANDRVASAEAALNQTERALKTYAESMRIRRELLAKQPGNTQYQRAVAVNQMIVGDVEYQAGQIPGALANYAGAVTMLEPLAAADPSNIRAQYELAAAVDRRGDAERSLGQRYAALASYERGLEMAKQTTQKDPGNARYQQALAVSYNKVGEMQKELEQERKAMESYRAAFEIRQRLTQSDPANVEFQHDLVLSYQNLCELWSKQGQHATAIEHCEKAIALARQVVAKDPGNFTYETDLSATYMTLGY